MKFKMFAFISIISLVLNASKLQEDLAALEVSLAQLEDQFSQSEPVYDGNDKTILKYVASEIGVVRKAIDYLTRNNILHIKDSSQYEWSPQNITQNLPNIDEIHNYLIQIDFQLDPSYEILGYKNLLGLINLLKKDNHDFLNVEKNKDYRFIMSVYGQKEILKNLSKQINEVYEKLEREKPSKIETEEEREIQKAKNALAAISIKMNELITKVKEPLLNYEIIHAKEVRENILVGYLYEYTASYPDGKGTINVEHISELQTKVPNLRYYQQDLSQNIEEYRKNYKIAYGDGEIQSFLYKNAVFLADAIAKFINAVEIRGMQLDKEIQEEPINLYSLSPTKSKLERELIPGIDNTLTIEIK